MNKFLFVHVPKCAGSFIQNAYGLDKLNPRDQVIYDNVTSNGVTAQHRNINTLIDRNIITTDEWNKFYSFAIVRNPYDRVVSLFHYLKRVEDSNQTKLTNLTDGKSFKDYIMHVHDNQHLIPDVGLDNVITQHGLRNQWKPMCDWMPEYISAVYKLEHGMCNITADIERVCGVRSKLKCDKPSNTSIHDHYSRYYDRETQQAVLSIYKSDFDRFGYSESIEGEKTR